MPGGGTFVEKTDNVLVGTKGGPAVPLKNDLTKCAGEDKNNVGYL